MTVETESFHSKAANTVRTGVCFLVCYAFHPPVEGSRDLWLWVSVFNDTIWPMVYECQGAVWCGGRWQASRTLTSTPSNTADLLSLGNKIINTARSAWFVQLPLVKLSEFIFIVWHFYVQAVLWSPSAKLTLVVVRGVSRWCNSIKNGAGFDYSHLSPSLCAPFYVLLSLSSLHTLNFWTSPTGNIWKRRDRKKRLSKQQKARRAVMGKENIEGPLWWLVRRGKKIYAVYTCRKKHYEEIGHSLFWPSAHSPWPFSIRQLFHQPANNGIPPSVTLKHKVNKPRDFHYTGSDDLRLPILSMNFSVYLDSAIISLYI